MMIQPRKWLNRIALCASLLLAGPSHAECDGDCTNAASFLTVADVQNIMAQAIHEATARGAPATVAVVDRVGNVLGVFRMNSATDTVTISSERGVAGGLEGIAIIPASLAAIAKAITAAYLSSEGNAFTTRTANQIVQENFNPGETNRPSGPLFGVQFSNLPCSDIVRRFGDAMLGPKRSPLGFSADPGGIPLYKGGAPVGGVGIVADSLYGLDALISDVDNSVDEAIADAAASGYAAPLDRLARRITVDGKSLRFTDSPQRVSHPANAPAFSALSDPLTGQGSLIAVTGYTQAALRAGVALGEPASGIRLDTSGSYPGVSAYILVNAANVNRYPPSDGSDGGLQQNEVRQLLTEALRVASRARAQIRRPLSTAARVSIAVVDGNGVVLGLVRSLDAPLFGTDVAVQKARTAAFFSGPHAAADLSATPAAQYLVPAPGTTSPISAYVTATRSFLGLPDALSDAAIAFSNRAIGNLARPYFPDGIGGGANGPLSKSFENWSPFSDGLQLDLVLNRVVQHVGFVASNGATPDTPMSCTELPDVTPGINRLPNGIQIFPGSVPIYKGNKLVGGIGVSGDGVDQDDMIAFLGLHNTGQLLGTVGNAPKPLRADRLTPFGTRLRYVQCPQAPFINSTAQNVCAGL